MATSLVDEFINDIEEEENSSNNEADSDQEMREEEGKEDEKILEFIKSSDLLQVAHLLGSERFTQLLERVSEHMEDPNVVAIGARSESDPQYKLIVECNEMTVEITNEISVIHKWIRDRYAPKFPELEGLVLNPLDYAKVVHRIGNQTDLSVVDLSDILPAATIMAVTLSSSTTRGKPLGETEMQQVMDACKMALDLDNARRLILEFVEGRMSFIAPNLSTIVGTAIAAKLMTAGGGLHNLIKVPASNLSSLGKTKRHFAGFSTASSQHINGYIYDCELLQKTPPSLRLKASRVICSKSALAIRADYFPPPSGRAPDSVGRELREQIEKMIEKWQEPPPPKQPKPLAAPDDKPKPKRAGVRVQKQKQKYAITEMRKQANRLQFNVPEESILSGDTTKGLGMLGSSSGTGKVRLIAQEKGLLKKYKDATSGTTTVTGKRSISGTATSLGSGLATSLSFTPVQGLELSNPEVLAQMQAKVNEANEKYFGSGGFTKVRKSGESSSSKSNR